MGKVLFNCVLFLPVVIFGCFEGRMIIDSAPVDTLMGTYTGIRQIAVTLGFIIGPIIGGTLVEAMGNNYRWVWLIMFVFLVLATIAMLPVTKGESRQEAV